MKGKPKVLFFSTGDSTRSQMAEGFLRAFAGDEVVAASTAVKSIERDPLVVEVMKEVGVDISAQRPKDIASFFKEHFAYVVTLCDATTEKFPVWPFSRNVRLDQPPRTRYVRTRQTRERNSPISDLRLLTASTAHPDRSAAP